MYIQKKKFFSVSNSFKLILGSLLQSAPKTNSRCEDTHFPRDRQRFRGFLTAYDHFSLLLLSKMPPKC